MQTPPPDAFVSELRILIGILAAIGAMLLGLIGWFIKQFVSSTNNLHKDLAQLQLALSDGLSRLGREFADHKLYVVQNFVDKPSLAKSLDRLHERMDEMATNPGHANGRRWRDYRPYENEGSE